MSRASETVILMSDTHRPLPLPTTTAALHFTSLAALVNAHYACSHGFDFLYLVLSEDGCTHPHSGRRHPSYCKLTAVAAAMRRWSVVAFVDSDSWFSPDALPLDILISSARGAKTNITLLPSLSFAWDQPYSNGPNCGFMVWRNSTRAQRLLATWWHTSTGYDRMHDFEQRAMYWAIAHLESFRGELETLQLAPLALDAVERRAPIVHIDHTRRTARYFGLSVTMLSISAAMRSGRADDFAHASIANSANETLATLRRAATMLAKTEKRGIGNLRRSVLRAALAAAKHMLRRARYPSADASVDSTAFVAGVSTPAGRRLASCMRVRDFNATRAGLLYLPTSLVSSSEEVRWASPWLTSLPSSQPSSQTSGYTDSEAMLPETLVAPAADQAGASASSDAATDSPAAKAITSADNPPHLLEGMPLALRPCSTALDSWQLWLEEDLGATHVAEHHSSSGGSGTVQQPTAQAPHGNTRVVSAGSPGSPGSPDSPGSPGSAAPPVVSALPLGAGALLRLAAHPELCAAVGPGRALREPYLPLAQLTPCPPTNLLLSHPRSAISFDAESKAYHTLSAWALDHEYAALTPLLSVRALWPDAAEARRRPNPTLFLPGSDAGVTAGSANSTEQDQPTRVDDAADSLGALVRGESFEDSLMSSTLSAVPFGTAEEQQQRSDAHGRSDGRRLEQVSGRHGLPLRSRLEFSLSAGACCIDR